MAKVKIPKRVAGVKIPRKVRRKAKKALRMADSPAMQGLAAAALGAARARPRPTGAAPLPEEVERIAEAVRFAALDGLRRFLEGFEEGLRAAAERDAARP